MRRETMINVGDLIQVSRQLVQCEMGTLACVLNVPNVPDKHESLGLYTVLLDTNKVFYLFSDEFYLI